MEQSANLVHHFEWRCGYGGWRMGVTDGRGSGELWVWWKWQASAGGAWGVTSRCDSVR
jgi:hypothetical protein